MAQTAPFQAASRLLALRKAFSPLKLCVQCNRTLRALVRHKRASPDFVVNIERTVLFFDGFGNNVVAMEQKMCALD